MDTWESVKDIEVGSEVRISTKLNGYVHGFVVAKDEEAETISIGRAGGEVVVIEFGASE